MKKIITGVVIFLSFCFCSHPEPMLMIDNAFVNAPSNGGVYTFVVKTNQSCQVLSADSWAEVVSFDGDELIVSVSPNGHGENRLSEVIVTNGSLEQRIEINQKGKPILSASNRIIYTDNKGETIAIDITSNVSFSVDIDSDWIEVASETRSLLSKQMYFKVLANDKYEERMAHLFFTDKSGMSDTVCVIQKQLCGLVAGKRKIDVCPEGSSFSFDVLSNVEYEIFSTVDWITEEILTKGLDSYRHSFTTMPNDGAYPRVAYLILKSSDGELTDRVVVSQNPLPYIRCSEKEFILAPSSGEFSFIVTSNQQINVEIEDGCSWLHNFENTPLDTTRKEIKFRYDFNTTFSERLAIITISGEDGLSKNVVVIQNAKSHQLILEHYGLFLKTPELIGEIASGEIDWGDGQLEYYPFSTGHKYSQSQTYTVSLKVENVRTIILHDINEVETINLTSL